MSESPLRRVLEYFGLVRPPAGAPKNAGASGRSRYGLYASPRLDEDIDELRERVAALERQGR